MQKQETSFIVLTVFTFSWRERKSDSNTESSDFS